MLDKDLNSYIKQIGLSEQDYIDCKDLLRRPPEKLNWLSSLLCGVNIVHINPQNSG